MQGLGNVQGSLGQVGRGSGRTSSVPIPWESGNGIELGALGSHGDDPARSGEQEKGSRKRGSREKGDPGKGGAGDASMEPWKGLGLVDARESSGNSRGVAAGSVGKGQIPGFGCSV